MLVLILAIFLLGLCVALWLDYHFPRERAGSRNQKSTSKKQEKFQIVHEILGIDRLIALFESKDKDDVAAQEQVQSTQNRTLTWIKGYTILTGLIVCIAFYQSYETRQTLIDSQRPWVVAASAEYAPPEPNFPPPVGPLVRFRIKNYGTSVATAGWLFARLEPNDTVWLTANWRSPCKDIDNFRQAAANEEKKTNLGAWPVGFVLAPGDDTTETVGATPVLDQSELDAIKKRGNSVAGAYIVACMEYMDQFKNLHVTTTCFNANPSAVGLSNFGGSGLSKCNAFQTAN